MNKKSLVFFSLIIVLFFIALIIYGCGQVSEKGTPAGIPKIVFYSERDGQNELYIMNVDGSNQTRLTQHGSIGAFAVVLTAEVWDPAISPDGTKIAYVTNKDDLAGDTTEIYVSNLDGSNLIRLTDNSSSEHHPTWSSDSNWIAFSRYYDTPYDGQKIFKIKSDGTGGETELASSGTDKFDSDPDWSHDGTTIVFASTKDSGIEYSEIFTMEADGSNRAEIFGSLEAWSVRQPRWSPDGSKILICVYASLEGSSDKTNNIFVMDSSTYTLTQLTTSEHPVDNWEADWSENGTKIIFASDRDVDEVRQIYIMNADGSNPQRLTDTSDNRYPVWKKP